MTRAGPSAHILLAIALAAGTGCGSTWRMTVPMSAPEVAKANVAVAGAQAEVLVGDRPTIDRPTQGRTMLAEKLVFRPEDLELIVPPSTEPLVLPLRTVREVEIQPTHARRLWSPIAGAVAGAAVGALLGRIDRSGTSGYVEAELLDGAGGAAIGVGLGMLVGWSSNALIFP